MNDASSRSYIGLLAKFMNSFSSFMILLTFFWIALVVSTQQSQQLLEISKENFQISILSILVTILESNLIPLHWLRVMVKLLTSQPILQNWSSCIDPIFTSNPSIILDSGIEKSLCSSCHHDIMFEKINFRVPLGLQECWR